MPVLRFLERFSVRSPSEHMFVKDDPNHKGNVAETAIAAAATKLGIDVSKPLVEHTRYDLIFGMDGQLLRVQCKWAPMRDGVIQVKLVSARYLANGEQVRTTYSAREIDALAVYCEALDRCYLVPISEVAGMKAIYLRLAAPRNGQRASINWAAEYELEGAVAQLGERRGGTAKVTGSSPVSSTSSNCGLAFRRVGANPFRSRFGWYMQRAAAGERFLVTRRGKPYVRLSPANDQLELDGGEIVTPQPSLVD
jgi:prevent-host-death family protein